MRRLTEHSLPEKRAFFVGAFSATKTTKGRQPKRAPSLVAKGAIERSSTRPLRERANRRTADFDSERSAGE